MNEEQDIELQKIKNYLYENTDFDRKVNDEG